MKINWRLLIFLQFPSARFTKPRSLLPLWDRSRSFCSFGWRKLQLCHSSPPSEIRTLPCGWFLISEDSVSWQRFSKSDVFCDENSVVTESLTNTCRIPRNKTIEPVMSYLQHVLYHHSTKKQDFVHRYFRHYLSRNEFLLTHEIHFLIGRDEIDNGDVASWLQMLRPTPWSLIQVSSTHTEEPSFSVRFPIFRKVHLPQLCPTDVPYPRGI